MISVLWVIHVHITRSFSACGRGFSNRRATQMLLEKGEHVLPAVYGLLGSVPRPVDGKEAVACAVVAMELVVLAEAFELFLDPVDLLDVRIAIVIPEYSQ